MRVIGMAFLCVRQCAPLRPCRPPVPPTSRALPPLRVLPWCLVRLFCCFFLVALRCSRAPCVCPLFFSAPPLSCRPASPHSPVSHPMLCGSSDPACFVRLPSLSVPRFHSCVPPACSTPAPLCRPYPSPWCLSQITVIPSVPVSHLIPEALSPVWGGGVLYLRTGLWPCPRTGMTLAVGFLRTMSHRIFRRNTEGTTELRTSLCCICTVDQRRLAEETSCGDSVRSYSNQTRAP